MQASLVSRCSIALLGLFTGLVGPIQGQTDAQTNLRNGSFEQALGDRPAAWRPNTWGGEASFAHVPSPTGRTGSRSVMISSSSGADAAWSQRVSIEPFTRYRLSAWIKTKDLKVTNGRGALLNIHEMQGIRTRAIKGTQDWTRVECEFTGTASSIMINCLFGGWGQATGQAWFDDVHLETLEKVIPVSKTVDANVTVNVKQRSEAISPYIYGQFIEHLGRCIYGGIWAEMLEDRKFYFPVPATGDIWRLTGAQARVLAASPWKILGSSDCVKMVKENAFVGEHSPHVSVPGDGTAVGIYQEELGLVKGKQYEGYIIVAGDAKVAPLELSLVWGDGPDNRDMYRIKRIGSKHKKHRFMFRAGADTDNARLVISSKGKGLLKIGTVSLMPADNVEGFRKDTLALLKQLNAPVYRWPGGNFVSGYDWRDGLGDRDKRPTRTNPAWTGIETNDVGMDEFVRLCQLIDTEPMIAVNTGFGDAYSAAAEVEYANGAVDTSMGKWRAQNGHAQPFDIKWWCVGNEMYGRWQLGYMQLNHYVLKHNWIEAKMREVDPTIKTVGVGSVGEWTEGMFKNCAENMDLLSEHFYCQERGDLVEHVRQVPNQLRRIAQAHRAYRKTITGLKEKDIRIALDEWNYWYGPHVFGELGTRYFLKDALGITAGLHEYFRNSDIYFMANYAQTVNVIGCIKTTKTQAEFAATGLPLMLYRREFGTIPVQVKDLPEPLDIAAALTDDQKALTIGIVNPTWDAYNLQIDLQGAQLRGKAKTWIIAGDTPLAYNAPGQTPALTIDQAQSTDLTGPVSLEPLSITLYRVNARSN